MSKAPSTTPHPVTSAYASGKYVARECPNPIQDRQRAEEPCEGAWNLGRKLPGKGNSGDGVRIQRWAAAPVFAKYPQGGTNGKSKKKKKATYRLFVQPRDANLFSNGITSLSFAMSRRDSGSSLVSLLGWIRSCRAVLPTQSGFQHIMYIVVMRDTSVFVLDLSCPYKQRHV